LARRKYADLSGEGGRLYGGRYNPQGVPAVYAAQSASLAILEVLVHLDKSEIPEDYLLIGIGFDGRRVMRMFERARIEASSASLAAAPDPDYFRDLFYDSPVLRVRSAIVPREYNYVLLPEAKHFSAQIRWTEPFAFDQRLFSL
jgi:RES domain-containing protein